jgi:DNA-binding CsgD family transcriptional regulator
MTPAPQPVPPGAMPWANAAGLTERELIVAELYVDGASRVEMADAFQVRPATVKRHLENIALKIGGPGTLRARICRYIRGRRDAALAQHHQRTPMAWEQSA